MMEQLISEMKEFNEAAKAQDIVVEDDVLKLKEMRDGIILQNSNFPKFQSHINPFFKAHIDSINSQINGL